MSSVDTVRKRWRNIYQKIADHPEVGLFPTTTSQQQLKAATRGPEKRRTVIQYVDAHLEEIRPWLA